MKWLKIDPDRIFRLRITINIIVFIAAFIYLAILIIVFNISNNANETASGLVMISPFIIGLVSCFISDKVLHHIEYKAGELQMIQFYHRVLYSEALQNTALREQVADGGYCDDEYLEEYSF